ncbi:MAG TPA: hypothetical protein VK462_07195 [Nitrososphaeraceae archaeon]|jgi:hypothetical protein|nr:hypothetical protein [Nitrososphaeraceae archaeon]
MVDVGILAPEKTAFIAYNIGVYESVQKFGNLITSGKITVDTDVPKVAELLSESSAFYDPEMIAGLINAILLHNAKSSIIDRVTAEQVRYVMNQLKATGISLP